jgi:hypothetical protein
MLRDKKVHLRVLALLFLAGGIFGLAMESQVRAASSQSPVYQAATSETPTNTPSPTKTEKTTKTRKPTRTRTPTRTKSPTRTLTPTPTITNTGTLPTPTPSAPKHVVISEFRTIGPLGANDEFFELYNPTGTIVNIGNWYISKSSGCGTSVSTLVYIYYGTILQPGQHYLIAAYASYSSITNADQRFSPGIADNGGLALINSSGSLIDQVGMCNETYYHEGKPLPALPVAPLAGTPTPYPGTSDQSYERKPGGNTSCYDTGDNFNDFILISPANPQNQSSGSVLCAGVSLTSPTPSPTVTITPTRTPTRAPTAIPAMVVLNEFLPHPQTDWNGDGIANNNDEYIEIINVSPNILNVINWKLDTGINSPKTFSLPDLTLQPRQIATFFGSETGLSLSDGGSTVRLINTSGRVVDAYTYPVVELPERTWCRLPDGSAFWGFNCRPTPGLPNVSVKDFSSDTRPGEVEKTGCPQVNVAPPALVFAECGNFGAGIVNNQADWPIWLQDRWKWDVFLE